MIDCPPPQRRVSQFRFVVAQLDRALIVDSCSGRVCARPFVPKLEIIEVTCSPYDVGADDITYFRASSTCAGSARDCTLPSLRRPYNVKYYKLRSRIEMQVLRHMSQPANINLVSEHQLKCELFGADAFEKSHLVLAYHCPK